MAEDRPASLEGAPGNLRFVPGDHMKNALGAAALLRIVAGMLHAVVEDPCGITKEDFEEFRETLNFIKDDLCDYVESFEAAVGCSLPSWFAVFSQDCNLVSQGFNLVSQDSVTPSHPLAKIAALLALPQPLESGTASPINSREKKEKKEKKKNKKKNKKNKNQKSKNRNKNKKNAKSPSPPRDFAMN